MLYFAYGSNMSWIQMQHRCPSARFICTARLPDYTFAIARHSRLRACGTANIVVNAGSAVWGVVYEVSDNDMTALDAYEDGYSRKIVFVLRGNANKTAREALTYIAPQEFNVPLPNAEYKRLLLEGARHWQLPSDYCLMLQQLEAAAD